MFTFRIESPGGINWYIVNCCSITKQRSLLFQCHNIVHWAALLAGNIIILFYCNNENKDESPAMCILKALTHVQQVRPSALVDDGDSVPYHSALLFILHRIDRSQPPLLILHYSCTMRWFCYLWWLSAILLPVDVVPSSAVYKPFIVIELSTHIPVIDSTLIEVQNKKGGYSSSQ